VHIASGTSNAAFLRKALKRKVVPFRDVLSFGPAGRLDPEAPAPWVRERMHFWNGLDPTTRMTKREENDYVRLVIRIFRARSITLWHSLDVAGLILSAWLTSLGGQSGLDLQVDLRELPPANSKDINLPARVPVAQWTPDFLNSVWQCWSMSSPNRLVALYEGTQCHRERREILAAVLDRYPDEASGLSRWEMALLRNVRAQGPRISAVIGETLIESAGSLDPVGDVWLYSRLNRLANVAPHGLVSLDCPRGARRYAGTVSLTDLGDLVASGEANVLGRRRFDDWVGNVRLGSQRAIWVRTRDGLRKWRSGPVQR
jgi:hypothetical protein